MDEAKFPLGQTVITSAAMAAIPWPEVLAALGRHTAGDWGEVCDEDRQENERALREGSRLLSVYHSATDVKFYVITEHDRSVTTVLLPEDY